MNKIPDISRIIAMQELMLKFRGIKRMVWLPPGNTEAETDVKHSYTLAMATWFLAQYFPKVNTDKAIRLALVHDLVEVHAGDTFAYASPDELASKPAREAAALKQLEKEWPDFPELAKDIREYEEKQTEEAKFVYALDKLMPAILNYLNQGHTWQRYSITFDDFLEEKEKKVPVSPEIYDYHLQLVELLKDNLHYFHKDKSQIK